MADQDKRSTVLFMRRWAPTVLYIVMIMVMAARPAPKLPHLKHVDKYLHALAYGILAVLSFRSFSGTGFGHVAVLTLSMGILVGLADEGIQLLSRMRTASLYDLLADVIGVSVGILASMVYRKHRH